MKRSHSSKILWLSGITILCLLIFAFTKIPLGISNHVESVYGPSSDSLSSLKKTYLSILLLLQKQSLTTPNNALEKEVSFQVQMGESASSVSIRLQNLGLINNPSAFRNYLVYSGADTKIQAGNYVFNPQMTPIEIAWAIQDATPDHIDFVVLAGWRAEEIAEGIITSGLEFSPEMFLDVVWDNNAEGYMLPGTYTFSRDISPDYMIQTLINTFNAKLVSEIKSGFNQQGLSIEEAVILASIVERESVVDDEMSLIASVFLNRLAAGMLLNADPTVQYALGYNIAQETWWSNPLSSSDLLFDSPYNTYLYAGLPPGPICSPGLSALSAVAFPASTPYYYFRAACDKSGRHLFAVTLEEHIQNACP